MTLRASLHDYLRDEIDVPVHETRLPRRPMLPAVVQRFITGNTVQTHSNRRSLVERRIQVDVYANNWEATDDLATRILLALDGFHGVMGDVAIGWMTLVVDTESEPIEFKGTTSDARSVSAGASPQIRFLRSLDFALAYQEGVTIGS